MDDVTIVGGGICGLSASIALAKKGYEVTVISELIGKKTCGGGFTEKAIERYPWLMEKRHEFDGRIINGAKWFYHNDKIEMKSSGMLCVRRQKLDKYLKKVAESEGVKFQKDHIKKIKFKEKPFLFTTKGKKINTNLVFDATGAIGPLVQTKKKRFVGIQHIYGADEKKISQEWGHEVYMFSDFHKINGFGYSWIFPDENHVKAGTGILMKEGKKHPLVESEINYLIRVHAPFLKKEEYSPEGAYISCPSISIDPAPRKNYFIGGDAAGLVNALGEGNYYAMLSAEIFASNLDQEEYRKNVGKLQNFLKKQYFMLRIAFGTRIIWLVFKAVPLMHQEQLLHDILRKPPLPKEKFRILEKI